MKKHILALLALAALAGCSKNIDDGANLDDNMVRISSGIATRAVDQSWAAKDAISVFAYNTGYTTTEKAIAENVQHNADAAGESSTFTPNSSGDYFFYPTDGTNIDVYAIYPYADATTLTAYSINVATTAQADHTLIDLMSAKAEDNEKSAYAIDMTFNHKLAQIKVTLTAATNGGLTEDKLKTATVTLGGTKIEGNYNMKENEITTVGDATSITLTSVDGATTFMVIPQSATLEFTITVDGVDYTVTADNATTIESGNIYTYAISVSQTAVKILGSTINAWGSGGGDSLDASDHETPDIELANGVYYINNAAGLQTFVDMVNNDNDNYKSISGTLINDIDLSEICGEGVGDGGTSWTPIGNSGSKYSGIFNGNGKTISGLYINTASNYQGLFGYVDGGSISNLTIKEPAVTGGSYSGAVCGYALSTPIENCSVVGGSVNGASDSEYAYLYVGGVVGRADSSSVTSCYNTGEASGNASCNPNYASNLNSSSNIYVGGVVGWVKSSYVTDCYNIGDISATSSDYFDPEFCIGGVVGYTNSSHVTESYNTGHVSVNDTSGPAYFYIGGVVGFTGFTSYVISCYNTGEVNATSYYGGGPVGGVVGHADSSTVTSCYNKGKVSGSGFVFTYAGGVAGSAKSSTITSSYNTGEVSATATSTTETTQVYAGGVVGDISYSTITSCYNTWYVRGTSYSSSSKSYYNIGGVVGYFYGTFTITTCYFIDQVDDDADYGVGSDTSSSYDYMKLSLASEFIAEIDVMNTAAGSTSFVPDSDNINDGYPILSWQ